MFNSVYITFTNFYSWDYAVCRGLVQNAFSFKNKKSNFTLRIQTIFYIVITYLAYHYVYVCSILYNIQKGKLHDGIGR
jgi:hypothetical protein